ncbi:MAG: hypothetical protein MZV65_53985 [Chromatiales bacterium]|nr:hypothetical protein [Chromatiales bacterium]
MVTRLAGQKGLDIVCEALDDLLGLGLTLVILGTGEAKIQDFLAEARQKNPVADRPQDRLRRTDRPHDLRRQRPLPHPLALRAVRADPDVRHEVRHRAGRPGHGRPRRQRPGVRSRLRQGQRLQVRRSGGRPVARGGRAFRPCLREAAGSGAPSSGTPWPRTSPGSARRPAYLGLYRKIAAA